MPAEITVAETDADILACFSVMQLLRPHLIESEFVARVHRQRETGYRLARMTDEGQTVAVAGFRQLDNLAWGKFLYVDDLVTDDARRSHGYGRALLHWLRSLGRAEGCTQLHLDSGTQRLRAHAFYEREGMAYTSKHFAEEL